MIVKNCNDCGYYEYIRCYGSDCHHENAPPEEKRGDEFLAENRHGNYPKWCPMLGKVEGIVWLN